MRVNSDFNFVLITIGSKIVQEIHCYCTRCCQVRVLRFDPNFTVQIDRKPMYICLDEVEFAITGNRRI